MVVDYQVWIIDNHIKEAGQLLQEIRLDRKKSIIKKEVVDNLVDMAKSYKNIREIANHIRQDIDNKEYK